MAGTQTLEGLRLQANEAEVGCDCQVLNEAQHVSHAGGRHYCDVLPTPCSHRQCINTPNKLCTSRAHHMTYAIQPHVCAVGLPRDIRQASSDKQRGMARTKEETYDARPKPKCLTKPDCDATLHKKLHERQDMSELQPQPQHCNTHDAHVVLPWGMLVMCVSTTYIWFAGAYVRIQLLKAGMQYLITTTTLACQCI